jgi:hypothetical protein
MERLAFFSSVGLPSISESYAPFPFETACRSCRFTCRRRVIGAARSRT